MPAVGHNPNNPRQHYDIPLRRANVTIYTSPLITFALISFRKLRFPRGHLALLTPVLVKLAPTFSDPTSLLDHRFQHIARQHFANSAEMAPLLSQDPPPKPHRRVRHFLLLEIEIPASKRLTEVSFRLSSLAQVLLVILPLYISLERT